MTCIYLMSTQTCTTGGTTLPGGTPPVSKITKNQYTIFLQNYFVGKPYWTNLQNR